MHPGDLGRRGRAGLEGDQRLRRARRRSMPAPTASSRAGRSGWPGPVSWARNCGWVVNSTVTGVTLLPARGPPGSWPARSRRPGSDPRRCPRPPERGHAMSRLDTVQWGADRLRVGPWRGDHRIAYLAPTPGQPPDAADDPRAACRTLRRDGLRLGAHLGAQPGRAAPVPRVAASPSTSTCTCCATRSTARRPSPPHRRRSTAVEPAAIRRGRRRDRDAVLEVDHLAFSPFWRFDRVGPRRCPPRHARRRASASAADGRHRGRLRRHRSGRPDQLPAAAGRRTPTSSATASPPLLVHDAPALGHPTRRPHDAGEHPGAQPPGRRPLRAAGLRARARRASTSSSATCPTTADGRAPRAASAVTARRPDADDRPARESVA